MHRAKIIQINAYPTFRAPYMQNLERKVIRKSRVNWLNLFVWTCILAFCLGFWWTVIRLVVK